MEFNRPLPIHNSITFIGFWHQEAGLVNVDLPGASEMVTENSSHDLTSLLLHVKVNLST